MVSTLYIFFTLEIKLMVLSPGTVRAHLSNILGKLHAASRTQATLYALWEGLASMDKPEPDE